MMRNLQLSIFILKILTIHGNNLSVENNILPKSNSDAISRHAVSLLNFDH